MRSYEVMSAPGIGGLDEGFNDGDERYVSH